MEQQLGEEKQTNKWVVPAVSIFLGLLVGAVAMLVVGFNPISAYGALFSGVVSTPFDIGETIRTITPLIFTGLAVAFAFRTGLFNIGVEGQFMIGQLVAVVIGLKLDLPPVLHALVALVAGVVCGALWAFIPGLLKAKLGVHEVITTIMLNFVGLYTANVVIRKFLTVGADTTPMIADSASLQVGFLSDLFEGARIHLGVLIALLCIGLFYYILWKTTLGFELRAVGFNRDASEYAGINVSRKIVTSMMISGAFAGLGGAVELLGTSHYMAIQGAFTGIGFDGIAVALLGASAPIGILLSAVLFGFLTYGGQNMQFDQQIPFEVVRIVIASIILFVASSAFVGWAKSKLTRKRKEAA
ncbi:ABC transporter permease [Numidum massiliense]|uniref:ABC transporter permease n=1 Tax=Numidum massiliense TaxID=1522315 RepID=UPI0006D5ADFB|nr:ABC transporter permease [Numidum massiliense]